MRSLALSPWVLLGCGLLPVMSCSLEPRSCDLTSDAIILRATVTDNDEGIEVELELESGSGGTPLELCDESEALRVNGEAAKLVRVLGHAYYTVEFEQRSDVYTISYEREDGDISIELAMPPNFTITSPAEGASPLSADMNHEIQWDPGWPGHRINLALEDRIGSDCIEGLGVNEEVDDTGSWMLASYELEAGTLSAESCEVYVSLTRSLVGEYPASLHAGGSVEGFVKRRRRFDWYLGPAPAP